jgi:hypothetical protein
MALNKACPKKLVSSKRSGIKNLSASLFVVDRLPRPV